jgi:hypothetical protein
MCERGACEARVANVIAAMKALLAYARDIHRVQFSILRGSSCREARGAR